VGSRDRLLLAGTILDVLIISGGTGWYPEWSTHEASYGIHWNWHRLIPIYGVDPGASPGSRERTSWDCQDLGDILSVR
jgi:hypothetical protein